MRAQAGGASRFDSGGLWDYYQGLGWNGRLEVRLCVQFIDDGLCVYICRETLAQYAEVRKRLLPLKLFAQPETGGQLGVATHLYGYTGHEERDARRAAAMEDPEWLAFLGETKVG